MNNRPKDEIFHDCALMSAITCHRIMGYYDAAYVKKLTEFLYHISTSHRTEKEQ